MVTRILEAWLAKWWNSCKARGEGKADCKAWAGLGRCAEGFERWETGPSSIRGGS
jgi:hypothetical protein